MIDAVVTSDEVPHGRPHPDMIRQLMQRLGVQDPLRVAKVGDTRADLAALKDPGRLGPAIAFASAKGMLPVPVNGVKSRDFGAPDGSGGSEKGISIATRPACAFVSMRKSP